MRVVSGSSCGAVPYASSFAPSAAEMRKCRAELTSQDWAKIYSGLGLGKETVTELQAFRARHTSATNRNAALKSSVPEIDLSHYR